MRRVRRIPTSHHRKLPRSIIDKHIGKRIAALCLANSTLSSAVAGSELVRVDGLDLVVGVSDEVVQEEDGGVCVRRLALGVSLKCTVGSSC
jgi:hypothetical protein